jgi:beta-glucosidase
MVTPAGDIIVPAGQYGVTIGGGQPGSGLPTVSGEFSVASQLKLPE